MSEYFDSFDSFLSLTKESKYSEILLSKYNKCLFSYVYSYLYIFQLLKTQQ